MNGPANAIAVNSNGKLGLTETYPGANIRKGLPINLKKIPNNSPGIHRLNIASYPRINPTILCANS